MLMKKIDKKGIIYFFGGWDGIFASCQQKKWNGNILSHISLIFFFIRTFENSCHI
jgi:hypothetical protein